MAIESYPEPPPPRSPSNFPSPKLSLSREPGCFTTADDNRSLLLTQLDGTTDGFPLTWIYRWQWRQHANHESLIITLSEHEIEICGKNLHATEEYLSKGRGIHFRVKDDRYLKLQGNHLTQISSINVKPTVQRIPEPN